jgi:hypothetical protein
VVTWSTPETPEGSAIVSGSLKAVLHVVVIVRATVQHGQP